MARLRSNKQFQLNSLMDGYLHQEHVSGTYLDYSSSEFEAGEISQGPGNSSYEVASDDRVLR